MVFLKAAPSVGLLAGMKAGTSDALWVSPKAAMTDRHWAETMDELKGY